MKDDHKFASRRLWIAQNDSTQRRGHKQLHCLLLPSSFPKNSWLELTTSCDVPVAVLVVFVSQSKRRFIMFALGTLDWTIGKKSELQTEDTRLNLELTKKAQAKGD